MSLFINSETNRMLDWIFIELSIKPLINNFVYLRRICTKKKIKNICLILPWFGSSDNQFTNLNIKNKKICTIKIIKHNQNYNWISWSYEGIEGLVAGSLVLQGKDLLSLLCFMLQPVKNFQNSNASHLCDWRNKCKIARKDENPLLFQSMFNPKIRT